MNWERMYHKAYDEIERLREELSNRNEQYKDLADLNATLRSRLENAIEPNSQDATILTDEIDHLYRNDPMPDYIEEIWSRLRGEER